MRLGMVINLIKCTGCYSCVIKCKEEHLLPPGMTWAKLLISETGISPHVTKQMYPVLCNHCKEPACAKACPTGATQQDDNGIVWVDQDKCVGCRYCLVACPYQVRTYYAKEKEYFPGQGFTELEKVKRKLYPLQTGVVHKWKESLSAASGIWYRPVDILYYRLTNFYRREARNDSNETLRVYGTVHPATGVDRGPRHSLLA